MVPGSSALRRLQLSTALSRNSKTMVPSSFNQFLFYPRPLPRTFNRLLFPHRAPEPRWSSPVERSAESSSPPARARARWDAERIGNPRKRGTDRFLKGGSRGSGGERVMAKRLHFTKYDSKKCWRKCSASNRSQ
jgi:hypothetical protein